MNNGLDPRRHLPRFIRNVTRAFSTSFEIRADSPLPVPHSVATAPRPTVPSPLATRCWTTTVAALASWLRKIVAAQNPILQPIMGSTTGSHPASLVCQEAMARRSVQRHVYLG